MTINETEYLTPKEATEHLRVASTTLRNWRWKKFGPPWVRLGKSVLYPRAGLDAWLKAREGL